MTLVWKTPNQQITILNELVGRKKIVMKTIQELNALDRELTTQIDRLSKDMQFLQTSGSENELALLRQRLNIVKQTINHYRLYEWLFNANNEVKRNSLLRK